jgi:hypothetical protein
MGFWINSAIFRLSSLGSLFVRAKTPRGARWEPAISLCVQLPSYSVGSGLEYCSGVVHRQAYVVLGRKIYHQKYHHTRPSVSGTHPLPRAGSRSAILADLLASGPFMTSQKVRQMATYDAPG